MNFDGEYRRIGAIDIAPLAAAVRDLPEAAWEEHAGRQQVYKAHARTQTIPLIFDPDMRHEGGTVHPAYEQFIDLLRPALDIVQSWYADKARSGCAPAYFARILLVRLAPQAAIGSHRDHGHSLSRAHRIHLPVITSSGAEFGIAGVIKHLPAGEIWEINNRKAHAVRNVSDLARVHAIFDYVLPGETVEDPEGLLVA